MRRNWFVLFFFFTFNCFSSSLERQLSNSNYSKKKMDNTYIFKKVIKEGGESIGNIRVTYEKGKDDLNNIRYRVELLKKIPNNKKKKLFKSSLHPLFEFIFKKKSKAKKYSECLINQYELRLQNYKRKKQFGSINLFFNANGFKGDFINYASHSDAAYSSFQDTNTLFLNLSKGFYNEEVVTRELRVIDSQKELIIKSKNDVSNGPLNLEPLILKCR